MSYTKYNVRNFKYIIGVDEAGRAPLAGPVSVAAVFIRDKSVLRQFTKIKDSKQLSAIGRELWFLKINRARALGALSFSYALISHKKIDNRGLTASVHEGIFRALAPFEEEKDKTLVLLDGLLHAPAQFLSQITIIKGDEKERVIAMASIVAKVMRDRKMVQYARKYPMYGFEKHKGYGTAAHRAALRAHGMCCIHRRRFCKEICRF